MPPLAKYRRHFVATFRIRAKREAYPISAVYVVLSWFYAQNTGTGYEFSGRLYILLKTDLRKFEPVPVFFAPFAHRHSRSCSLQPTRRSGSFVRRYFGAEFDEDERLGTFSLSRSVYVLYGIFASCNDGADVLSARFLRTLPGAASCRPWLNTVALPGLSIPKGMNHLLNTHHFLVVSFQRSFLFNTARRPFSGSAGKPSTLSPRNYQKNNLLVGRGLKVWIVAKLTWVIFTIKLNLTIF